MIMIYCGRESTTHYTHPTCGMDNSFNNTSPVRVMSDRYKNTNCTQQYHVEYPCSGKKHFFCATIVVFTKYPKREVVREKGPGNACVGTEYTGMVGRKTCNKFVCTINEYVHCDRYIVLYGTVL